VKMCAKTNAEIEYIKHTLNITKARQNTIPHQ